MKREAERRLASALPRLNSGRQAGRHREGGLGAVEDVEVVTRRAAGEQVADLRERPVVAAISPPQPTKDLFCQHRYMAIPREA